MKPQFRKFLPTLRIHTATVTNSRVVTIHDVYRVYSVSVVCEVDLTVGRNCNCDVTQMSQPPTLFHVLTAATVKVTTF
jgi:hypothetical protein